MKPSARFSKGIARSLAILILALALLAPMRNTFALSTVDTQHLGVGALIIEFQGQYFRVCTGTLIAPQVFLTAGDCTALVQSNGDYHPLVSFDQTITTSPSLVNVARVVTDPDYDPANHPDPAHFNPNHPNLAGNGLTGDTHDLGLLLLATPVLDRPLSALPAANLLDALNLPPGTPVTAVGYGIQTNDHSGARSPNFYYYGNTTRDSGVLSYSNLTPPYMHLSMLDNLGSDNICFGDFGGPDFVQVNGQEQLAAINFWINSYDCQEVAWLYRLDTPQARAFLGQYVALP